MNSPVTSIVVVGIGGQGVIRASDILAEAAFRAGHDVKKSEVRGMSQRGGYVASDVRFGEHVLSPVVPMGEADYLVATDADQITPSLPRLAEGGIVVEPSAIDTAKLPHPKSLNVALLGALSVHLDIPGEHWVEAIKSNLPPKVHDVNVAAFELGMVDG